MSTFVKLHALYTEAGLALRTGLNPYHWPRTDINPRDIPFTALSGCTTGGGISPIEVCFIDCVAEVFPVRSVFVIGNAFGWSTLAMAIAFSRAKVVALDAENDGPDNRIGNQITTRLADIGGLNAHVEIGYSPQDVPSVVSRHFSAPIDLFFIDGLHTNEQCIADFYACREYAHPRSAFLFHDVINWDLRDAFNQASKELRLSHSSSLLERTSSGMGFIYPNESAELAQVTRAFHQS